MTQKTIKELHALSRGQLIGKYQLAVMASLLVTIIRFAVEALSNRNSANTVSSFLLSYVISIIIQILSGALVLGEVNFYLKLARNNASLSLEDIFYGFRNNFDKAILVQIPLTVISVVASLPRLLIVLGIINASSEATPLLPYLLMVFEGLVIFVADLFLALVFYVLCDNPGLDTKAIYEKSIEIMSNKKGRYFLTCLSLIPLGILSILACGLGVFWFMPYRATVMANFYLDAIGEAVATEAPTPAESDRPDYSI